MNAHFDSRFVVLGQKPAIPAAIPTAPQHLIESFGIDFPNQRIQMLAVAREVERVRACILLVAVAGIVVVGMAGVAAVAG